MFNFYLMGCLLVPSDRRLHTFLLLRHSYMYVCVYVYCVYILYIIFTVAYKATSLAAACILISFGNREI